MLEGINIEYIRTAFTQMQSTRDLLNLLNAVKPYVYGKNSRQFELKQLTWYGNPNINKSRYHEFCIKKRSGANRSIHAPVNGLKAIQKSLAFVLQNVFEPHTAAMGFVKNKSIVKNAVLHEGQNYVYNIDLKDFFSSIDQARVWKCLQLAPFNLCKLSDESQNKKDRSSEEHITISNLRNVHMNSKGQQVGYNGFGAKFVSSKKQPQLHENCLVVGIRREGRNFYIIEKSFEEHREGIAYLIRRLSKKTISPQVSRIDIANIVAALCCTEMAVERKDSLGNWEVVRRNVLPQGAPTSPIITNVVCQRLDHLLSGLARRFGLKYSRYADDITFSSMHNVYNPESEFITELHRIITDQGFHIKDTKTRLQKDGYRKEVTGLLVNHKVNVRQRYIKQLRMWLYYWERYGYERASEFFLQEYVTDKGHVKKGKPDMVKVIAGKLDYLRMVKGNDNELYRKLSDRLNSLLNNPLSMDKVMDIWERFGVDKAMNEYFKNSQANE